MRTPEEVREWLRCADARGRHICGDRWALFSAHFIDRSHAIWISFLAYCVYHLVMWPRKRNEPDGFRTASSYSYT